MKSLYFTEKLLCAMSKIPDYPLTIVEAPMGYGKTTAVRELLSRSEVNILWQRIYEHSLSSFWNGFCTLFSKSDEAGSQSLLNLQFPTDSAARRTALSLLVRMQLPDHTVIVIDDYHLAECEETNAFLEFLIRSEILDLPIVLGTRYTAFPSLEEFKLKGYLHYIEKTAFEFSPADICAYYKQCGIDLQSGESEKLYAYSEGWISALYLLMLHYKEGGSLFTTASIYKLVEKAVYEPFSEEIKEFLLTLCIFDSFNLDQAAYMWRKDNARQLLAEVIGKNAFIYYDAAAKTYQMHNIFTNVLKDILASENRQTGLYARAAQWYLQTGEYLTAMDYFYRCGDFENLLRALELDQGDSFFQENKSVLIGYMEECPPEIRSRHHLALLVYAMFMFVSNETELFGRTCAEFMTNLEADNTIQEHDKKELLGEYELLLSFTEYNDINKMSEHNRKACLLLSHPTEIYDTRTSWSFGCPSVLYLFYRESGKLKQHVEDIKQAMPYYYQLTDGHGSGAEYVMEAERYYHHGDFQNAEISLRQAMIKAQANHEAGMARCAGFVQIRLALLQGDFTLIQKLLTDMRLDIVRSSEHYYTIELCEGYLYAVLKQKERIPEWIAEGNLDNTRLMFPAYGMFNIVYGRVLLMSGEYLKLIGSAAHFLELASVFPNLLGQIYTYIYLAAANRQIARPKEALAALEQALALALPDQMYMPFVENCDYLKPQLAELQHKGSWRKDIEKILKLNDAYQKSLEQIAREFMTGNKPVLTKREAEIAKQAAEGLSNRQIAEKLYVSQNTVKTQLKSIFEKLGISSRVLLKQYIDR